MKYGQRNTLLVAAPPGSTPSSRKSLPTREPSPRGYFFMSINKICKSKGENDETSNFEGAA